jgi:RecA-family ATPase
VYVKKGFTISDPSWQEWLSDTLEEGFAGDKYKLLIIDTLMRTAGAVDENRMTEMITKIFKPLSTIAAQHKVAIQVVHHMKKGKNENNERGGQLMHGTVAGHAWSEDSIYLSHTATDDIVMDFESKTAPGARYMIQGLKNSLKWEPKLQAKIQVKAESVTQPRSDRRAANKADHARRRAHERGQGWSPKDELPKMLHKTSGRTIAGIARQLNITTQATSRRLKRAEARGLVTKGADSKWRLS